MPRTRKRPRGNESSLTRLSELIADTDRAGGNVLFITGAGISSASGIPCFRYNGRVTNNGDVSQSPADAPCPPTPQKAAVWSVGSQRMATRKAFLKDPLKWYNEFWMPRFPNQFLRASPNAAHKALASIAASYEGVLCVTQNIDGLHSGSGESGIPLPRLIECHGRIGRYKCTSSEESGGDRDEQIPMMCPYEYSNFLSAADFSANVENCLNNGVCNGEKGTLVSSPICPSCGRPASPLALLFDEGYESHSAYRFEEMQQWLEITNVIVFVGTSHSVTATSLALAAARRRQIPVFEFNLVRNLRGMTLERENGGGLDATFIAGPAESTLPLLANMCGVGLVSSFSVEPLLPVPLPEASVMVELDAERYCRLPHPNGEIEASVDTEWESRTRENPKLFNGLKFRLHAYELTKDGHLTLKCGITDYKTFIGCSYGPYAKRLLDDGRSHYGSINAYLSGKLGVGCALETSDGYVVLIQRSKSVAEGRGQMDGPGGHPEPDRVRGGRGEGSNDDGVSQVHEVFSSILQEIEDEINIPKGLLSPPLLLAIIYTHSNLGSPIAVFSVHCMETAAEIRTRYNEGPKEAFESERIVLVEAGQLLAANQARHYFSAMGIQPTPSLMGILSTWRNHKKKQTL